MKFFFFSLLLLILLNCCWFCDSIEDTEDDDVYFKDPNNDNLNNQQKSSHEEMLRKFNEDDIEQKKVTEEFETDKRGYTYHQDIKTTYWFVNRKTFPIKDASYSTVQLSPSTVVYSIPLNENTSIIVGLRNKGSNTFNITKLEGFLHAAQLWDFYVENYTKIEISQLLLPHSEITFEYRLEPWEGLSTVDYVFSGDITYQLVNDDDNSNHMSSNPSKHPKSQRYKENRMLFANVTINVYDPSKLIDFELIFLFIIIAGFWIGIALTAYVMYYIPAQQVKGKQPLTINELWNLGLVKTKSYFYSLLSRLQKSKYPTSSKNYSSNNNADNTTSAKSNFGNKSANTNKDAQHDDWLSGTAIGAKKKASKKPKKQ